MPHQIFRSQHFHLCPSRDNLLCLCLWLWSIPARIPLPARTDSNSLLCPPAPHPRVLQAMPSSAPGCLTNAARSPLSKAHHCGKQRSQNTSKTRTKKSITLLSSKAGAPRMTVVSREETGRTAGVVHLQVTFLVPSAKRGGLGKQEIVSPIPCLMISQI